MQLSQLKWWYLGLFYVVSVAEGNINNYYVYIYNNHLFKPTVQEKETEGREERYIGLKEGTAAEASIISKGSGSV